MTTNGSGFAGSGLAERLASGVAMSPITAKPEGPEDRRPDDKVLGTCDDYLKRYHYYRARLNVELQPLIDMFESIEKEVDRMMKSIKQPADSVRESFARLAELQSSGIQAKMEQLEELKGKIEPLMRYANWVDKGFWLEVKNRFPDSHRHFGIAVRSDWSVVGYDEEQQERDDIAEMLQSMMGGVVFEHRGSRAPRDPKDFN